MRDPAPLPPPVSPYLDHAAARRIIFGVLLAMMLAALDSVMVATALPTIAANLGDIDNMSWVVTANLLSATASTPLFGKLSDIYGRRTMMLIAIGIYAAGSVACALAPSMLMLILARALQGLGGGGLMPLVQTIIGDVASPLDRPRYQTYTSSTFIISTVAGPLLGGFIAEHLHWSWIFWVNVPLCARRLSADVQPAAAAAAPRPAAQPRPAGRGPDGRRGDRADAGADLGRAALRLGLAADPRRCSPARRRCGRCSPGASMAAAEPFIPLSVLRDGALRVGTASAFFAVGTVIALTIMLPLYAQLALGLTVSESAMAIIALQGAATVVVGRRRAADRAPDALQARAARRPRARDRGARAARHLADRLLAGRGAVA